ncbi:MAG TPA: ribonuclease III [Opitutales bacterium]|nr:ribonuclease III [Opitutales bacterium]
MSEEGVINVPMTNPSGTPHTPEVRPVPDLSDFEKRIGYVFTDKRLLRMALTHPSWAQQHAGEENNQRLEFLGDSVLSLILARELFDRMPHKREGVLTRSRAALAKRALLSTLALELGIDGAIRLSEAEERNGGRSRQSILEDALESVAGAVYLDAGFDTVRGVVLKWYGDVNERLGHILGSHNPKGQLQELVQPTMGNEAISYVTVGEEGPPHLRQFRVRVEIQGKPMGEGTGSSKKEAEESAAREALTRMQAEPEDPKL